MELLHLFIRMIKSRGAIGQINAFKFTVTHEGEYKMLAQVLNDPLIPEGIRSSVMWQGVRAAFPKIYGYDVEWDAKKNDLVKKEGM